MEDSNATSIGETETEILNVRAFVANFERRNSADATGVDSKPPVVTKSRVALLREAIGRTPDAGNVQRSASYSKAVENDSLSSDENEVTRGNSNAESGPSVAKLKENLERSAVHYGVRPRRNGKEPKRDHNKDVDDDVEPSSRIKDLTNTCEKVNDGNRCRENLNGGGRIGPRDEHAVSNKSDGSNESINKFDEMSGFVKKKKVPKILPKPAPRNRPKPGDDVGLVDRSHSADRPVARPRNHRKMTHDAESGLVKRNESRSVETLGKSAGRETNDMRDVAPDDSSFPDRDDAVARNPLENCNKSHYDDPAGAAKKSNFSDVNRVKRALSVESDSREEEQPVTKLSSGDEGSSAATIDNGSSKTDVDESETPSAGDEEEDESLETDVAITSRSEAAAENANHRFVDSVSFSPNQDVRSIDRFSEAVDEKEPVSDESTRLPDRSSSNEIIDSPPQTNAATSVLIREVNAAGFQTAEEQEYDSYAIVLGVKICDGEDEIVKRVICPGDDVRSALDYVDSLYRDDVETNFDETKTFDDSVDDEEMSSLSSSDSMREFLLDKATKKSESLKKEKEKLDNWLLEQERWEEDVDATVKAKTEAKQYKKYRTSAEEFDKVTHLLLKLASRLAVVDNSIGRSSRRRDEERMSTIDEISLTSKRNLLTEKFDDARTLKDGIEARRRQIVVALALRLTDVELADCRRCAKTKCRLNLMRQSIEDRTQIADDQMKTLVMLIENKTASTYC